MRQQCVCHIVIIRIEKDGRIKEAASERAEEEEARRFNIENKKIKFHVQVPAAARHRAKSYEEEEERRRIVVHWSVA